MTKSSYNKSGWTISIFPSTLITWRLADRMIFSDLAYADDTYLLFSSEDNITPSVHSFSQAAATLGLRTSWAKTKLQNLGSGPSPSSLQIDDNSVESVDSFVYFGSLHKSEDNYSRPDTKCRITGLAWQHHSCHRHHRLFVYSIAVTMSNNKKQESSAIAKMTARCAVCMGALKIFGNPWLRLWLLFPKFLMGFCSDWAYKWARKIWIS